MRKTLAGAALLALLLASAASRADVVPNGLFNDHLVLQRGRAIPVWGQASPGERVTVSLAGHQAATTAAADGGWMVHLPALPAGGPHELTIAGANTITLKDVLVGEVWVCSGQSNMQWNVGSSHDAENAIAQSADAQLRLITIPRRAEIEPQRNVTAAWSECGPTTVKDFSAVGYFFGRKLRRDLNVPIGLISTNYGGTPAEAWTEYGTLFMDPALRPLTANFEKALAAWPQNWKTFNEVTIPAWEKQAAEAKANNQPIPRRPGPPMNPRHQSRPAGLYNAMIAPLVPYGIAGAIWYQGESNAGRPKEYQTLFPTMIRNWRKVWGQGDFPFLFVQLAPFMKIKAEPAESGWAELREAQLMTLQTVPNTHMAVITDVGEENDIHPKKKVPVGERLALGALKLSYGWDVEWLGPLYHSMRVDYGSVRLSFSHVGGGLVAKDGPLTGWTIAGRDRKFHNAEARIDGDEVVVWSPQVKHPAAVRFGWADYPVVNFWNRAGLPATPFRTDSWPRQ